MSENKQVSLLINLFKTKVLKHEYFLILLLIVAVALPYLNIPESNLFTIFILAALTLIYFMSSYIIHEVERTPSNLFVYKISSIASAITTLGILFNTQNWPDSTTLAVLGILTLFICLIYILFQNNNKSKSEIFNKAFVVRIIVLIIISAGLILENMAMYNKLEL